MNVLNADEAANFLRMNKDVLRRKANQGLIPGRKAGRCWIFIEEHLADWVSGRYPEKRELRVVDNKKQEDIKCQSTSAAKRGGFKLPQKTADAYNNLLQLK